MIRASQIILLTQWVALGVLVGGITGTASALFLVLLEHATAFRMEHDAIVWCLPLAGLAIGWVYERFGEPIRSGNDLVIDTIHDEGPEIPARMAPMVLLGTVLTHLFGGSAGREGTAVQMGASLSDWLSHRLHLSPSLRQQMLSAGVAGGFGSVFGTPIAGAVFGLEFVVCGQIQYRGIVPALVAAVVGDMVTHAWGVHHTHYPLPAHVDLDPALLAAWLVIAALVAMTTMAFVESVHIVKKIGERHLRRLPVRMLVGGSSVVLMWQIAGTGDYLGLGIPTIVRAFEDPSLPTYAFALKLLFTALTIGSGFLGGEVTPLFFIGATLGSTLGPWLGVPIEMAAGVGLAAAFGCASNAPIALSIMAVELLGANLFPHVVIVSVFAYVLSGHRGIYSAQRLFAGKDGDPLPVPQTLRDARRGPSTHVHAPAPRNDSSAPTPPAAPDEDPGAGHSPAHEP